MAAVQVGGLEAHQILQNGIEFAVGPEQAVVEQQSPQQIGAVRIDAEPAVHVSPYHIDSRHRFHLFSLTFTRYNFAGAQNRQSRRVSWPTIGGCRSDLGRQQDSSTIAWNGGSRRPTSAAKPGCGRAKVSVNFFAVALKPEARDSMFMID